MIDTQPPVLSWFTPHRAAYLMAAIVSLSFAYDLMRVPIQVSDSLVPLLDVQRSSSPYETFVAIARRGAYMRPMSAVFVDVLFDLSQGRYWLVYRGFHALLLTAALLLFVRALDVRTWSDCAAAIFGLTVFTGLTTFRGTVREAFPVNHFLVVVVCCLLALNLVLSKRGGWWVDVAAVGTFLTASLTLESGLLVWVIVIVAFAWGLRGVSSRGMTAMTACLAGYFFLRWFLSTGTPGLEERSSGFLLRILEPEELIERFGSNPYGFYVYNVATSMLSVLFSDPDGGVFEIARAWLQGDVPPRLYLAVVASTATTMFIGWMIVRRVRDRTRMLRKHDGPLLVIAGAVLVGNSAFCYAYTKHEILSVAGAFYAIAAFITVRQSIDYFHASTRRMAGVAVMVMLAVMASMWTFRSAGTHYMLRAQAFRVRNDWARVTTVRWQGDSQEERLSLALVRQLRRDALETQVVNPYLLPRWVDRWWGE